MALERKHCEKHDITYQTRCIKCVREHMESPEGQAERAAATERLRETVAVVLPFASRLKERMTQLGKQRVRVACPDHKDKYITATIAGSRRHLHFACEVEGCRYWMME